MTAKGLHILRTGCKINLFLRVGPKLPTGMHEIHSLFLPLDEPGDRLEVRPRTKGLKVCFRSENGSKPGDIDPDHNTLTRAWQYFADSCGFAPGLDIVVYKQVPQGAGLGGGSANAAALLLFLHGLAKEKNLNLPSDEHFRRDSAAVGADVPFFLLKRPALARGVGEILTSCPNPFAGKHLLLVCPNIAVSTGAAFAKLDAWRENGLAPMPAPFDEKTRPQVFVNDFEKPVFDLHPELAQLHTELEASGAVLVRMSGTGASLFAIYTDEIIAKHMGIALASRALRVYMQHLPRQ
ncbi:4-(cytidine 5'-diphospho)-2-C-methyl-D-erythritol kinase [Desulfovibrio sp. OttesenSCG-928-F20]|nr:4-(cytidine 5'-diphospho)-2-C-methyl-D-erythritol kinase [Desulfovibrio sp. OttesenSCG-928-F20]